MINASTKTRSANKVLLVTLTHSGVLVCVGILTEHVIHFIGQVANVIIEDRSVALYMYMYVHVDTKHSASE